MTTPRDWKPKRHAHDPADYEDEVVWAVRALAAGTAVAHQQQLAWEWIMYVTGAGAEFQDLSFRPGPDGQRETDFAEGKRFVGLQLRKMLHPMVTPKSVTAPPGPPTPPTRRR